MKKIFCLLLLAAAWISAQDLASLFKRGPSESCFKKSLDFVVQVPGDASPWEILAAAETVNRLCQERIEIPERFYTHDIRARGELVILLREKLRKGDPVTEEVKSATAKLGENQALVRLYSHQGQNYLLVCGTGKAVHQAALAFYGRYPYFSELLGSEVSTTHHKVIQGLKEFTNLDWKIRAITYEFPKSVDLKDRRLDKFRYPAFIVGSVLAESDAADGAIAAKLQDLRDNRLRGQETGTLSFADIRCLELRAGGSTLLIPRSGATAAELTPPFKPFQRKKIKPYTASLEGLLTNAGILIDANDDGFPDSLKSSIIVNASDVTLELIDLAGHISSHMTGTTFPLIQLDSQVDDISQLDFPILFGPKNTFIGELLDKGKVKKELLASGGVHVQNNGLGPSPALLVCDRSALAYLVSHFAAFQDFNWGEPTLAKSFTTWKEFLAPANGGDVLHFRSLQKKLAPESLTGFVSDRFNIDTIQKSLLPGSQKLRAYNESQVVKEWEQRIPGEGSRISSEIEKLIDSSTITNPPEGDKLVGLEVRVSESPAVRAGLQKQLVATLQKRGKGDLAIEVNSAYKFAYFYILERFLPKLPGKSVDRVVIRAPLLKEALDAPRRFYQDSLRWLYELYPVDEEVSRKLNIPLERVEIMADESLSNAYLVTAESGGQKVFEERIEIFPYFRPYLKPFPGWGDVQVLGGRIVGHGTKRVLFSLPFTTDLELFWNLYQDEVLPFLLEHIRKKTGGNPKLDNQPFFRQLKIELDLSEPDFRTGVDEEMVSSLEAIHDEIYFDTLDLLAGILKIEKSDKLFNMRKSSPGNVLPLVHPSSEGHEGNVKITLTDDAAREPQLILTKAGQEAKKTLPDLQEVKFELVGLELSGKVATARIQVKCDKEAEFEEINGMLASLDEFISAGSVALPDPLLSGLAVETRFKEDSRAFRFKARPSAPRTYAQAPETIPERILSPDEVVRFSQGFAATPGFRVFSGGESLEKRELPAIFACDPSLRRFSLAKLLLEKPTLFFSARQHSNEVSSSTYVLQALERMKGNGPAAAYLQGLNLLVLPVENPDGAALAYELQKLTSNHSLHAGRYTARGVDVGYIQDEERPAIPEALVRPLLGRTFKPDLYLNLHGYPSHEWVQPFSGYIPFLFRNYWIPKGMFFYYSYLNRPEAEPFQKTGTELLRFLAKGLSNLPGNQKFFQRYRRWSERWAPHLNFMDMEEGSLIFNRRENAGFRKVPAPAIELANETPELMDETAQGDWFKELLKQGSTYLKLHLDFFSRLESKYITDHFLEGERVLLLHKRLRPGKFKE